MHINIVLVKKKYFDDKILFGNMIHVFPVESSTLSQGLNNQCVGVRL